MYSRSETEAPEGAWDLTVACEFAPDASVRWVGKRVSQLTAMKGAVRVAFIRKTIRYRKKEPFDGWFAEIRGFTWNWRRGPVFDLATRDGHRRHERFFRSLSEAKAIVETVLASFPTIDEKTRQELHEAIVRSRRCNQRWKAGDRAREAKWAKRRQEVAVEQALARAAWEIGGSRVLEDEVLMEQSKAKLLAGGWTFQPPISDLRPKKRLRRR